MTKLKKLISLALAGSFAMLVVLTVILLNQPAQANQSNQQRWLENYINRMVQVTFVANGEENIQVIDCRIIQVEDTGLVLRFEEPNPIYFPYSSIYSIDP